VRGKTAPFLALVALAALSTWEIAALVRASTGAATGDDWAAAAAAVRAGWQPGDLVLFAPAWSDPVGRLWLGDLDGVHEAARLDAARYARIWEVSARGASAPDALGPVGASETFGALTVRRHDHVAEPVAWDLRARARLVEVDFAPRECVPLRPPATLDMGEVPLAGHLVVRAGLADFRARRDNRARARVRVTIDGAPAGERELGNDDGWAALPPIATTPGPHRVVFTSEALPAPGQPVNLDLCIAAEARP
jgi:hypothetical protein